MQEAGFDEIDRSAAGSGSALICLLRKMKVFLLIAVKDFDIRRDGRSKDKGLSGEVEYEVQSQLADHETHVMITYETGCGSLG